VIEKLKQALSSRKKYYDIDSGLIPSAVLLPIFLKEGEYNVLFTKRTDKVKTHKGQISYPGGAYEKSDGGVLNTALRECEEEIGLAAADVVILGELDDMPTIGSGYVISPFVGLIPWPYTFRLDPFEVDRIIEVPLSWLADRGNVRESGDVLRDGNIITFFYQYQRDIIWGASARIMHQFLEIYAQATGADSD